MNFLLQKIETKYGLVLLIVVFAVAASYIILEYKSISWPSPPSWLRPSAGSAIKGIEKFSSESDFKAYLEKAESQYMYAAGFGMGAARMEVEGLAAGAIPERVSETTVQVLGIDEPDIVKTDGKEIYFSSEESYYWRGFMEFPIVEEYIPSELVGGTKIIKAFPPADLAVASKIEKTGDLLLDRNILVIFSGKEIFGYDISIPKEPQEKWKIGLEDNNYVVGARLYKNQIYLITRARIDIVRPCPIRPLTVDGVPLEIKCVDIYHPVVPVPTDVTYNAMVLDPQKGEIKNTLSFVGSSNDSVVYMSEKGIYITYSYYESILKFFINFFKEECQDIIPNWVVEQLEKIEDYDISQTSKLTEFELVLEQYQSSLSDDESMRIENELTNRMDDYSNAHKRDLEKTGILKIGLDKFEVSATGDVAGRPINQFSLDEYQNHLRIATTIGDGWGIIGSMGESANDVYVLDENLKTVGFVQELGLTERIYSVRFIEDKGYVVTFRQTDPFYVLDLSVPTKPELKGELKIPGYSSYLHPITKDKILGIGKEGSEVKISLFDVSNPEKPGEADKYILKEYWSDILNTHHAFLLDSKHQIFFLPGTRGGYVFSHKNDQLKLVKTVSDIRARRAIYINDYLYIIGDDKLVVLNEIDWERVNEIEL